MKEVSVLVLGLFVFLSAVSLSSLQHRDRLGGLAGML